MGYQRKWAFDPATPRVTAPLLLKLLQQNTKCSPRVNHVNTVESTPLSLRTHSYSGDHVEFRSLLLRVKCVPEVNKIFAVCL